MCGLSGVFHYRSGTPDLAALERMTAAMIHRGPDDVGLWHEGPVALGHRRLSIIDLAGGQQPLGDSAGDLHVVFNGEIYNFQDLRARLRERGHRFRTASDTEVIVFAYREFGADFARHLRGMFAIALWDARDRRLILVRDRMGIKPLVYHDTGTSIIFANEIRALLEHPDVPRRIDPEALHLYLDHEFVPAPRTIIDGVRKLMPGEQIVVNFESGLAIEHYWQLEFEPKIQCSPIEARALFLEKLRDSVALHLQSDVPLGAFLSGGIDSSAIVALAAEKSSMPLRTFSIGFEEASYDESSHARAVAAHFGTHHHELMLRPNQALNAMDRVLEGLDEPLGDISAIPTFLVCELAKQSVTVCLSGDGGDELMYGYERHLAHMLSRNLYERLPKFVRRGALEPLVNKLPLSQRKKGVSALIKRFVEGAAKAPSGQQFRWQTFMSGTTIEHVYQDTMKAAITDMPEFMAVMEAAKQSNVGDNGDVELAVEQNLYLPNDVLMKLDWMSMAVSLEARVPFLDHEIVAFMNRLPSGLKRRFGRGKYLLRQAMSGILPNAILQRRKQGFGMPLKNWLRDELYTRVADGFASARADRSSHINIEAAEHMLQDHQSGQGDYSHQLWPIFVLTDWLRRTGVQY